MWISRTHYETMFENLTRARQEVSDLKQRIASMTSTQEWLTQHVNRLEVERRMLTETRLGMSFPVPTIEREPASEREAAPGLDEGSVHGTPHDSIALQQLLGGSLEDVGDDQAARMGMKHDEHGHLIYNQ